MSNKFLYIKRVVFNYFFLCITCIFYRIKIMRKNPSIELFAKPRFYFSNFFEGNLQMRYYFFFFCGGHTKPFSLKIFFVLSTLLETTSSLVFLPCAIFIEHKKTSFSSYRFQSNPPFSRDQPTNLM